MPTLSGDITDHGAVLVVLVGVSEDRRKALERVGFPVPAPIAVRALIDTGSHVTGFGREVFAGLGIEAFGKTRLSTPSTRPDEPFFADQYEVTLSFVSGLQTHPFAVVRAIASDDLCRGDEVEAIIGRDILNRCGFVYSGTDRRFQFFF